LCTFFVAPLQRTEEEVKQRIVSRANFTRAQEAVREVYMDERNIF
jgi:hypothetical protein